MAEQRPAYDEQARDRIRSALLRYKDDHRVGVPTLQLRIAEIIDNGNPDRVPLKSLQRFLAATHRTDDALVDHCKRFLMQVAPPPTEESLADNLLHFFGAERLPDDDITRYAAHYHGYCRSERAEGEAFKTAQSVLRLKEGGKPHFLFAEEIVFNGERDDHPAFEHPQIFRTAINPSLVRYNGLAFPYVAAGSGALHFLLLLRNYLHMRSYQLRPTGKGMPPVLRGSGIEPPFFSILTGSHNWTSDFYAEFRPVAN
ncbi:hypothetical protein [Tritonibacter mobilis]|uniref:hypothetical protein n=1 Tax=Tritonibacter mobilis TaxID=379347 RepID=UPI000806C90A|nr:hypothetical protein [Tritonibacter mobilis]